MSQISTTTSFTTAGPHISDNLFLKVFSGETLKVFNTKTVMKGRHRERTISQGRTAQFPAIGRAAAEYHTPGAQIIGQDINAGEKTITIDDMLISSTFVSNFEQAMLHYDVRSEYAFQMGQALAQAYDQHLFALATKAAQSGTTGAVAEMGPATEDKLGATPSLTAIKDAIYNAAAYFDSTNIPDNDRVVFVTPTLYWDLIQDGEFFQRMYGDESNGSKAHGRIADAAGFEIVMSNNLAKNFGVSTLVGKQNGVDAGRYTVDGTTNLALVMQKQALGTVSLMNVSTEKEYKVDRQGTLMVSRMGVGHDVLRPECLRLISART